MTIQQNQNPHSPPIGPRLYGAPAPDATAVFDDPGLTRSLDQPGALDATAPIWVRFGPGVPPAATIQDPYAVAVPQATAGHRDAKRRRRVAVSFVSLLTVAAIVAGLARALHWLP